MLLYNKALILLFIVFFMEFGEKCPKCKGTKRIQQSDGTIRPCWDCLMKGDMDQHAKNPKDSGVTI